MKLKWTDADEIGFALSEKFPDTAPLGVRGRKESDSREHVDRTYVFVVSQGSFRRANNSLQQLVLTIRTQILAPFAPIE